jgi:eukaryotic-like serine/threonine-protein kinase
VSHDPPDLAGAVLSQKYQLVQRIGYGGMGAVYATSQLSESGDPIAIKILNPDCRAIPEVVTRFTDEGRTCQRLLHPNIVRVFDIAVAENGCPYIVMELLSGVPLSAYTQNGGRVALAQCVTIVSGILAALGAAHRSGIVHRDLKPENVFLARDRSGSFAVKVLDFGIAKVMDVAGGMGNRTRTGALLGTPAYMSPEQIKSSKDVDARSDLFSAGVLTYEMLTGRAAFPAPTEYAKLAAVLNSNPVAIESIDSNLTRIAPFIERALQKLREHRYQSAGEMAQALLLATGAAVSDPSRTRLSHLPEVPSMYHPPIRMTPVSAPLGGQALGFEPPKSPELRGLPIDGPGAPGGTLASRRSTESLLPYRFAGGTLPSNDIPILEPVASGPPRMGHSGTGVRTRSVVLLCVVFLLIGFAAGLLLGRA